MGPLPGALGTLRSGGVRISEAAVDLDAVRRDLWPRDTVRLRRGNLPPRPLAVAWPREREEVLALLAAAEREGLAVVPYGAGSGVCGGARGREGALVIDLKRMNRIGPVDPDRRVVSVGAGVIGQHLEDRLLAGGFTVGHSPSSIICSTVGGWAAARGAGQFSSRYGVFGDILLGACLATPRGMREAGVWTPPGTPDLLPMFVGSEGSLGIFTDLLLRLAPAPGRRWLRGYAFPTLESAWEAMRGLMQAGLAPAVLRLYDPIDSKIAKPEVAGAAPKKVKANAALLHRLRSAVEGMPGLQRQLLEIPLSLPRLLNRITGGLNREVLLIIGFEGPESEISAVLPVATGLLSVRGRDLGPGPGEAWFARRHEVSYKLAPIFVGGAWADTMEVAASWSRLPTLYKEVRAALGERVLVMAHWSHAYADGCSIYFSFVGNGEEEVYDATWRSALAAARSAGGTVTHHHGVGVLKAEAAAREQGAALACWQRVKGELDPMGILNPGVPFGEVRPKEGEAPEVTLSGPGPVFELDAESRLCRVDPKASPLAIELELRSRGWAQTKMPDRPWGEWLAAWRPGGHERREHPAFGLMVRLPEGRAHLGRAPRSAAGPDLRPAALAIGTIDWVEVAIRPAGEPIWVVDAPNGANAEEYRPSLVEAGRWYFTGPAAEARAKNLGQAYSIAELPSVSPMSGAWTMEGPWTQARS
jgi:alkyldihydroxyacetonephosphate synthase